jgi:hypothetical protein
MSENEILNELEILFHAYIASEDVLLDEYLAQEIENTANTL